MQSKGYKYAISKIKDGNMSFKWGDESAVPVNRRKFLSKSGFEVEKCVTVHTSNSTIIARVGKADFGRGMLDIQDAIQADALITDDKEVGLFLLVADCAATIFYDPVKQTLCLTHLNGMNPGLIENVLVTFALEYGSNLADLVVDFSPSISKASFVIPDPFQRESEEWAPYIVNLDGHLTSVDMLGFLTNRMVLGGVQKQNISVSEIDTYKDPDYFSHRRSVITGEVEGRFAVVTKLI